MFVFVEYVGACDVRRHEVGCELDSLKIEIKNLRERAHHQRLR